MRSNGEEFPLEASLSGLETESGTLVTAVLRDVTDLQTARAERQAREALEASSRAKTEFLSRMSHELRTPLNAVLGFSQLLRLDAAQPPTLQQLERIQHIENAGAHLLALVNDVLDLSRVESGQMTVTLEPVAARHRDRRRARDGGAAGGASGHRASGCRLPTRTRPSKTRSTTARSASWPTASACARCSSISSATR